MSLSIGVDVSKSKFDAALMTAQGKYRSKVFDNTAGGFEEFLKWLDLNVEQGRSNAQVCMEATGVYHEALANFLFDSEVKVFVINPLRVKRFVESEGLRNKTDKGDAKALARFALHNELDAWEAPSKGVRELQALVIRLESLQAMRQSELNRLDVAHPSICDSIAAVIAALEGQIEMVRLLISKTIDDDPDLKQRQDLLETIPGLGATTIPSLLAYIGRPERFKTVKSLVAYAGLTPAIRQSGTSLDKRSGLHPVGHPALRKALFYPAMTAGRHNPIVAAFWQRLKAQNKPGKVILVACMHKLLAIAYGVLKSKRPFDASLAPKNA
jgi:transposase